MKRTHSIMGWIFSAPYIIFATLFFVIPLFWAFFLSITNWNLISPNFNVVWFDNFKVAIQSVEVRTAFLNSYKFIMIIAVFVITISFFLAYTIFNLPKKVKGIFSVAFFVPYITSGVAISFVVKGLISYNSPIAKAVRENFGIVLDLNKSATLATIVISIMVIWKMVGYYALFILSSLEGIGQDIHDAALLDGATGLKKIRLIVLPMIYPALFTVTILTVGIVFSIFTEPYMLTGGGPNGATNTWQLTVYTQSFVYLKSGYGAAIAILNAIVIFITLGAIQKLLKKWGKGYGWD